MVALPEQEYLELFNTTNMLFELGGASVSTAFIPQGVQLAPNGYLILCPIADTAQFSSFGSVVGISSWNSLTNSGELLELRGPDSTLIDAVEPIDGMYDLVLIDCPPAIGGFWANALALSTGIVIPLVPGPYEGESLKNLIDLLPGYRRLNENLDVLGVILTRSKPNTLMYQETRSAIVSIYGEDILFPPIHDRVRIPEATSHRQDIFTYDPKSPSAKEYVAATESLLKRLGYYDE